MRAFLFKVRHSVSVQTNWDESSLRGLPEIITSVPTAEALHSAASQHTRVAAISEPECTLSTGGLPDEETDAGITSQQDDQQGGGASVSRRRWNRANACASERPAARCPAQPTRCPALNPLALRLWLQLWRLRRLLRQRWGHRTAAPAIAARAALLLWRRQRRRGGGGGSGGTACSCQSRPLDSRNQPRF